VIGPSPNFSLNEKLKLYEISVSKKGHLKAPEIQAIFSNIHHIFAKFKKKMAWQVSMRLKLWLKRLISAEQINKMSNF